MNLPQQFGRVGGGGGGGLLCATASIFHTSGCDRGLLHKLLLSCTYTPIFPVLVRLYSQTFMPCSVIRDLKDKQDA